MNLGRFPRVRPAHLPTPLEHLPRLSRTKRDDCTGMSSGGNKTRKLEFLTAEARAEGADGVLTQGATQSNHARHTAACAARLGLDCHLLLEDRTGKNDHDYTQSGNVLLDRLHQVSIEFRPATADMNAELAQVAAKLQSAGRKPDVIPGGGSNAIGALGYLNAALELMTQAHDFSLSLDHVVHATGSAGTQAGLITGLAGIRSGVPLLGIGVRAPREKQVDPVFKLACATATLCGCEDAVKREDVVANCDYVGSGYGISTPASLEAIKMLASLSRKYCWTRSTRARAWQAASTWCARAVSRKGKTSCSSAHGAALGSAATSMTSSFSPHRIVGIIGGMGAEAAVELMRRVIAKTPASDDQEHVHLIVENNPKIPSRIAHLIEGTGIDATPELVRLAQNIERAGAQALAMPCNTAHAYSEALRAAVSIPLLDMVARSVEHVAALRPKARVGVLASSAVFKIGVYEHALTAAGLTWLMPPRQTEVMDLIQAVKRGETGECVRQPLAELALDLANRTDVILIACSELSVISTEITGPYVDSLDVLAADIIQFAA